MHLLKQVPISAYEVAPVSAIVSVAVSVNVAVSAHLYFLYFSLYRRYRGSLATHSEGSTTGEMELPSTMEEEEGGSQADTQSDCSQRELEKEQEKVYGQEKSQEQSQEQGKERLQSLEQEGESSSEEQSYQGPSRVCSSCSSSSQPARPVSASLPLPALTLFQCQEGCFTSTSSFHHQLVAIPAFRPGPWGEESPVQAPALG